MEKSIPIETPTLEKTTDSKSRWICDTLGNYIDSILSPKLETDCIDSASDLFLALPWPESIPLEAGEFCELLKEKKLHTLIPILCSLREIIVTEPLTESQYALLYVILYMLPKNMLRQILLTYLVGKFHFTKESVLWVHLALLT